MSSQTGSNVYNLILGGDPIGITKIGDYEMSSTWDPKARANILVMDHVHCTLKASEIKCWSMPLIDTLDWHLIDSWLILNQHLIDTSVDTQSMLDQHLGWRSVKNQLIFDQYIWVMSQLTLGRLLTDLINRSSVDLVLTEYWDGLQVPLVHLIPCY